MVQGYVLNSFREGKTTILWSTENDNQIKKNGDTIHLKLLITSIETINLKFIAKYA